MTVQPDDFAVSDDDAFVGNQFLEADAGSQFADGEQGISLLVIDEHIIDLNLVERSDGNRADADRGVQVLPECLLALVPQSVLYGRQEQQQIGQCKHTNNQCQRGHYHTAQHVICSPGKVHSASVCRYPCKFGAILVSGS